MTEINIREVDAMNFRLEGRGRQVLLGASLLIILIPVTSAQEPFRWPEKPQNFQVLPKDFPTQNLRAVMTGFTRALGVRCTHCHMGTEGEPLSSYDFPSDDNPNKNRAREMLRMLGSVNDHLKKIEPTGLKRVNMWCHTCHRGRSRPTTITEALTEEYEKGGIEAAIRHYRELRERYYGAGAYDFSENSLNSMGYGLLGSDKAADAIPIFRLNAEFHPESGNVFDSLAEAYAKNGQPELARIYYQKSLQIDPDNANAVKKLRELEAKAPQGQ